MAHCPIAQLLGPNLAASLCGATLLASPAFNQYFPGISTPFQGFAAIFIPGTQSSPMTHNGIVVERDFWASVFHFAD